MISKTWQTPFLLISSRPFATRFSKIWFYVRLCLCYCYSALCSTVIQTAGVGLSLSQDNAFSGSADQFTRSRFYLIRAYAIFDLVVQTKLRVNKRARSYLYRCKKVRLWCKLSDTKKVSSYMIYHIDIPFPKYTSIIQKYWYFFKSSF